jgi:probable F420-dependent oxidoreductase
MAFSNEKARFGITMFPTDYSIQPPELARAVEERGFDGLFFPEHTHIPTNRRTPFPGGGDLPKQYWHTHDPFVALGACAAVTKRIRLGTAICLVVERDPITLAKEVASVDMLSGGRFVLGIGAGWNREEMENHGANFPRRWDLVREKILAMKGIWTKPEPEFHGEFVNFDPLWSYPKPVQSGGPPIWIGANSKWVFDRIAEYGDGWMPIGGLGSGNMERLKAACDARGRKLSDITLALFAAPTNAEALRGRVEQGFDELIFSLASEPAAAVLPKLDELAKLAATVKRG